MMQVQWLGLLVLFPSSSAHKEDQTQPLPLLHRLCRTSAVAVQDVQRGDQELVGVLLLVAGQVAGVGPHQVEQAERDMRRAAARVELGRRGSG